VAQLDRNASDGNGWCEHCQKVAHFSKKGARLMAKQRSRGARQSQYRCPHNPNLWHNGHLPPAIKEGRISRHMIHEQQRRREQES
jgi:hypothetical protein